MSGISSFVPGHKADRVPRGATNETASASDIVAYGQSCRWVVMGLPGAGLRLPDSALDKPGTAGFALAVSSMWLVGVVSLVLLLFGLAQLWSLGRDRLGRLGQAGVVVSALALAAMAVGNGIELYAVTVRGTESDIGHTIFLTAFLILMVASILLGQILVRRRWSAGVRWAGLFLLLAAPLGIGFLVLGGVVSPETDLGFWSALSVPYAIARVLLALFAPRGDDITARPVATSGAAQPP
jgi:hypothetical protein